MNDETYRGLRFERHPRTLPRKLIPIGIVLVIFTAMWVLIAHSSLYWLMLPLVAVLTWIASYGWRDALAALHDLLHRLDTSHGGPR